MKKQVFYKVTFGDTVQVYGEEGFRNFVEIGVIHNKDINSFSAERISEKEVEALKNSQESECKEDAPECEEQTNEAKSIANVIEAYALRILNNAREVGPVCDSAVIVVLIRELKARL